MLNLTDIAKIQHDFLVSANKHEVQVSNVQLTVLFALFSNEYPFMSCSDIAAVCKFSKAQIRQSGDGVFAISVRIMFIFFAKLIEITEITGALKRRQTVSDIIKRVKLRKLRTLIKEKRKPFQIPRF